MIPQGWIVASDEIFEPSFVVRNLQPRTSYMFLVRAQNDHGISFPSPITAAVKTQGELVLKSTLSDFHARRYTYVYSKAD